MAKNYRDYLTDVFKNAFTNKPLMNDFTVEKIDGTSISLRLRRTAQVKDLKTEIERQIGIPVYLQTLHFRHQEVGHKVPLQSGAYTLLIDHRSRLEYFLDALDPIRDGTTERDIAKEIGIHFDKETGSLGETLISDFWGTKTIDEEVRTNQWLGPEDQHRAFSDDQIANIKQKFTALDKELSSQLLLAIRSNVENDVTTALNDGAYVNGTYDGRGNTMLINAAGNGYVNAAKALLKHQSIDVNAKNRRNFTALMVAAKNGKKDMVHILLNSDKIINVNDVDIEEGRTALMWAICCWGEAVVPILLADKRIDINKGDLGGRTALMLAILHEQNEVIPILLADKRIDINKGDAGDRTALMMAAYLNLTDIVKLLLGQNDTKVEAKNRSQETALSIAVERGHAGIVELLCEHGAHIDDQTIKIATDARHTNIALTLTGWKKDNLTPTQRAHHQPKKQV